MEGRNWRGAFPPLAPGPPPYVGLAPHPAVGGVGPPGGNYPLSSLFAAVASADPHAHFNSTIASDQAKAAAAAKVKQACLPCKKAHTACDEGRPCKKCVEMGKADQCVDVERKKAGRPKKNPAAAPAAAAATATTTTTTAATAAPPAKPQNEPSRKRARIDGPVDQKFVAPSPSPSPSPSASSSSSSSSSSSASSRSSPSQPPQPHPHQPPPHSHSQPPQPPPPSSSAHEPQPQLQPPQFGSVPAGQPQAGPHPQQQQQERQNEKELLSSAVSFLLDQVRLLSNTVESLRQEVNQLKSNQNNNINNTPAAADSPLSSSSSSSSSSSTTTTATAASVPFSCPSPMGNVPRSPSPLPSPSFASHPTPSGSTAYFYSCPPPLSSSPSPPSYSSPSPFSPPPPPTTTTGVSTSSSSSSSTLSTPPPPGHVVTTSTYTTQPGPSGGGQAQHQYIPIAALPHCREMMDHFSFLLAFDLKSSYLPFVVDDIAKPVCVVRSPPAGDDSVPPVFYFVNRPMADLLLYRVDELVGHSVLGIYAPDDKTKIQLMPHVEDLPFSPIILFSPLVIRKDGTIVRMSTRLQTFSTRRLTPDWTIIVVDGIEEVGATLGSSSMHVPQLPKWLGQNTTAFLKSVLSMTGLPRNPGGASLHEFHGSSPGTATASASSPSGGGMSTMGHSHIGRFPPSLRMLGDAGPPPHHQHQHHTSTTTNQHHPPLPQVSLEEVEEDVAGKPNPSGDADLNELLTQLMPASVFTPDYASWIGEGTGGGDYASPMGDSAAPDSHHHQPHQP